MRDFSLKFTHNHFEIILSHPRSPPRTLTDVVGENKRIVFDISDLFRDRLFGKNKRTSKIICIPDLYDSSAIIVTAFIRKYPREIHLANNALD